MRGRHRIVEEVIKREWKAKQDRDRKSKTTLEQAAYSILL